MLSVQICTRINTQRAVNSVRVNMQVIFDMPFGDIKSQQCTTFTK